MIKRFFKKTTGYGNIVKQKAITMASLNYSIAASLQPHSGCDYQTIE
jgi:hypothetical protein